MHVPKDCSFALYENERLVLRRAPCLHLGEGMPQVSAYLRRRGHRFSRGQIMGRLTAAAGQHFLLQVPALGKIFLYLVVVVFLGALLGTTLLLDAARDARFSLPIVISVV